MNIHYIDQSGFIFSYKGKTFAIDPWLQSPDHPHTLQSIPQCDYIFWTHDHFDHGKQDIIDIAKRDNAVCITTPQKADFLKEQWVQQVMGANIWGLFSVDNDLSVYLTPALHSCDIDIPVWFIIQIFDKTIYHMWDTWYFSDCSFLWKLFAIDVLCVPIGSMYTMWPREAVFASLDIKPQHIIPMHYNTFDAINQDPDSFVDQYHTAWWKATVHVMQPQQDIILI